MEKVIRGNDITVYWILSKLIGGERIPEDFSEVADLKIYCIMPHARHQCEHVVMSDNRIRIVIKGREQENGLYGFEALWSNGRDARAIVYGLFEVVEESNDAHSESYSENVTTIRIESDVAAGVSGMDGKEVEMAKIETSISWRYCGETKWRELVPMDALRFNYSDFTADNIKELQKPAEDVIGKVVNTDNAMKENELKRISNETQRDSSEKSRISAENKRITDETTRENAEGKRETAESERISAENRRVSAESSRLLDETTRQNEFKTAKKNVELATQVAIDTAIHPTITGEDGYSYVWDLEKKVYVKTDIYLKGNDGDSGVYYGENPPFDGSVKVWVNPKGETDNPIAGRSFLTPLFVARGAVFNDKTGYYGLNGLTDITETQMMNIYNYTSNFMPIPYALRNNKMIRTNYLSGGGFWQFNGNNLFANSGIEIANLTGVTHCMDAVNMFDNTPFLKKILGVFYINYNNTIPTTGIFNKARLLEDVKIFGMQNNTYIGDSPNFNRESILYLINNSANTKVITLTLHPTAKARLTSEDIALASSKNITIA